MPHKLLMKKYVTWDDLNKLQSDFLIAEHAKDEVALQDIDNVYEKVDTGRILILTEA